MCITLHFSTLNFSNQISDHLTSLSRSAQSVLLSSISSTMVHIFVSSANIFMLLTIQSWSSLTKIKNNSGLKTDPCGTLLKTFIHLEKVSWTITFMCLPARKFFIHFSSFPVIPGCTNLTSRQTVYEALCQTLYNNPRK